MKYFFFFCIVITLISCTSSDRTVYLKVPQGDTKDTINIAAYEEKYSTYDGVYLFIDESIEHTGSKDFSISGFVNWDFHYVIKKKYIILNPESQTLTTFELGVSSKAKIGTLYMQVTNPDGTVKRYGKQDLVKQDNGDGYFNYKYVYPNISKGSIVEEGFEMSYSESSVRPPLKHDIQLQFKMPCENVSFRYAYPDWWKIAVKRIAPLKFPKVVVTSDPVHHKKFMTYTASNVPAINSEPYSPYFKEVAQYLEFMVKSLQMGNLMYDAPLNWESYAAKFKPYIINNDGGLFSTKVSSTTKDIIEHAETPLAKIDSIVSFLQNTIQVVYESKDRDFADVLNDKKGDEYEITGVAYSMLKKAGFAPEYLLIHSAEDGYFDPDYYSNGQFSTPAVMVRDNGREIILFPYRKDIHVGQLPQWVQGQHALMISDKNPTTVTTLATDNSWINDILSSFDVTVGDDGILTVKEKQTFTGPLALFLRKQIKDMKDTEKEKFAKNMLTYSDGDVHLTKYAFENETMYKQPLVITFEYTIDNLVTITPEEILFHTGGLFSPAVIKDMNIESEERQNPITVHFDEKSSKIITIHYPEQWTIKTDLQPISITNNFGKLNVGFEQSKGGLTVKQERYLRRSSEPKEKITDFAALTGSKSKAALPALIFSKTTP